MVLTALHSGNGGDTAVHYAAALANSISVPLRIINPFIVPITLGEMPMPLIPVEEVRAAAEKHLDKVVSEISHTYSGLELVTNTCFGALSDILEEENNASKPLLTVLAHENPDDPDSWIGGDSSDILREGQGCVLVVTPKAQFNGLQHVCLACDTKSIIEGLPVEEFLKLQERLGFRTTVLHVVTAEDEGSPFPGSKLEAQLAGIHLSYAEISALGEVDQAIAAFPDSHQVDWLAMAPHQYGFWTGLFHKSHTTKVLNLSHVPVLGLH